MGALRVQQQPLNMMFDGVVCVKAASCVCCVSVYEHVPSTHFHTFKAHLLQSMMTRTPINTVGP